MSRVLLLSLPFGALERQALGLSLLKACLERDQIRCDVRYLTFPFAEYIGCVDYDWVGREMPYTAFAGDWIFTTSLYGDRAGAGSRLHRPGSARDLAARRRVDRAVGAHQAVR